MIRWIWLGPAAFLIHDGEEIATAEIWLRHHRAALPWFAQPFVGIRTGQFAMIVAALFAGYALAAWHGARAVRTNRRPVPFLLVTGVFVANGLTHLIESLYFRSYTPGVVTAALVNLPYGLLLLREFPPAGIASRTQLCGVILIGLGLQLVAAFLVISLAGGFR